MKQLPETSFSAPAVCFNSPSLHSHSLSHTAVCMQAFTAMRIIVSIVSNSITQGALLDNCTIKPWYFRVQNALICSVLIFFSIHQGSLLTHGQSFFLPMLEYAAVFDVDLSKQKNAHKYRLAHVQHGQYQIVYREVQYYIHWVL